MVWLWCVFFALLLEERWRMTGPHLRPTTPGRHTTEGQPTARARSGADDRDAMHRGTAELVLPSGAAGRDHVVAAEWWFPDGDELGVVWLQHGFARQPRHLAGLAAVLAAEVSAVVVVPAISSRFATASGYWINGHRMHDAIARLFGEDRRRLEASAAAASGHQRTALPEPFVLAGHSAGGNLAAAVAGRTVAIEHAGGLAVDTLKGVVMLDGVDRGGAIGVALDQLTGMHDRPVWTIAAPDGRCNAGGRGTALLQGARPGRFVGVRLAGGTHLDAEGTGSGHIARLACGAPPTENVDALRALAVDWITHLLADSPGDARLAGTKAGTTSMVGDARATTL